MLSGQFYSPLYLRGIEHFNRQAYFQSHEVWEDLWRETDGASKLFYKGLIQAAVALYHLDRGNVYGARKLLLGAQKYLAPYGPAYLGLDVELFLRRMAGCFDGLPDGNGWVGRELVQADRFPEIRLTPPPR